MTREEWAKVTDLLGDALDLGDGRARRFPRRDSAPTIPAAAAEVESLLEAARASGRRSCPIAGVPPAPPPGDLSGRDARRLPPDAPARLRRHGRGLSRRAERRRLREACRRQAAVAGVRARARALSPRARVPRPAGSSEHRAAARRRHQRRRLALPRHGVCRRRADRSLLRERDLSLDDRLALLLPGVRRRRARPPAARSSTATSSPRTSSSRRTARPSSSTSALRSCSTSADTPRCSAPRRPPSRARSNCKGEVVDDGVGRLRDRRARLRRAARAAGRTRCARRDPLEAVQAVLTRRTDSRQPAARLTAGAARASCAAISRTSSPRRSPRIPNRRYASAQQLADDLESFRRGFPVRARADTVGYRLRRFVGRHRIACAAAIAEPGGARRGRARSARGRRGSPRDDSTISGSSPAPSSSTWTTCCGRFPARRPPASSSSTPRFAISIALSQDEHRRPGAARGARGGLHPRRQGPGRRASCRTSATPAERSPASARRSPTIGPSPGEPRARAAADRGAHQHRAARDRPDCRAPSDSIGRSPPANGSSRANPDDVQTLRLMAQAYHGQATIAHVINHVPDHERAVGRAIAIRERVSRCRRTWQDAADLAREYAQHALARCRTRDPGRRAEELQQARAVSSRPARAGAVEPGAHSRPRREPLALGVGARDARPLCRRGRRIEAAIDLLTPLVASDADNLQYRADLAYAWLRMGDVRRAEGRSRRGAGLASEGARRPPRARPAGQRVHVRALGAGEQPQHRRRAAARALATQRATEAQRLFDEARDVAEKTLPLAPQLQRGAQAAGDQPRRARPRGARAPPPDDPRAAERLRARSRRLARRLRAQRRRSAAGGSHPRGRSAGPRARRRPPIAPGPGTVRLAGRAQAALELRRAGLCLNPPELELHDRSATALFGTPDSRHDRVSRQDLRTPGRVDAEQGCAPAATQLARRRCEL